MGIDINDPASLRSGRQFVILCPLGESQGTPIHEVDRSGFGWQECYAALTMCESQGQRVRHNIQNQRDHHER